MTEQRPPLEEQIRQSLDESVSALPAEVRSKLTQARHNALAQMQRKPRALSTWLVPAGGIAAVVLALGLWLHTPVPTLPETVAVVDLELLLADESLELVEELEFFIWLEGETDAG